MLRITGLVCSLLVGACAAIEPTTGDRPLQATCESIRALQWTASQMGLDPLGVDSSGLERSALRTRGARVLSAQWVPETSPTDRTQALSAHCKVLGEVLPFDPQAPVINFQVNLPSRWNGAMIQVGGGGLNGAIPGNLGILSGGGSPVSGAQPPEAPYPLNRGYVMFGGDSGHKGDLGQLAGGGHWALNEEAWQNFAHAGLKKTHAAALLVLRAAYGRGPKTSYFMGQSQGGREALEVAQRYPQDYDGVVASAPLIGYTAHVVAKTLLAGLQTGAGWISPEQAKVVGAEVLRQCDALDGLQDGVVSNYVDCNAQFNAAPLRCQDAQSASSPCLNDPQMATLAAMRAPVRFEWPSNNASEAQGLAHDWLVFPGYGTGREAVAWLNLSPQPTVGVAPNLGQPGITVQYGILKDPKADLLKLSIANERLKLQAASALIDSTNPDLRAFFARGGKLIIKSNSADYSVNPQTLAQWFERVGERSGKASRDRSVRYYVLPGAGHNGEGVSALNGEAIPHALDLVSLMLAWVEQGVQPPEAPVMRAVQKVSPYAQLSSRPMCQYPKYPAYIGPDPKVADSFRCTDPNLIKGRALTP
jgi:pimeloyl-ACP methyl ester carboxylesterase